MTADDTATNPFVTDTPLANGDSRPDLLERGWFAEQVARRIAQAGVGESVVFGLAGSWGTGKTSTLSQIKSSLEHQENDWVVVDFTPWAASDIGALTDEFYNTIASALDNIPGEDVAILKKMLNAAAPALAAGAKAFLVGLLDRGAGGGNGEKIITAIADAGIESTGKLQFDEDPFAKRFNAISDYLAELSLRILIIVDDIDRLHRDELLAVMKAVRLLGRFRGVHYLLSYDTETVTDVLTSTDIAGGNRRRAQQYLEKIVQYPFQLPPIQDFHLAKVIDKLLLGLSERNGYDPERGQKDFEILLARLPLMHLNLRSVYRLFAQVDMMLSLITERGSTSRPRDEIDLLDAILLTHLRLEHYDLYRHLPSLKADLTFQAGVGVDSDRDRDRARNLMQKIDDLAHWSERDHQEKRFALSVLRALFPDAVLRIDDEYRALPEKNNFQVRQTAYFDRYFAFGFPVNDIRDGKIRADLIQLIDTGVLPPHSVIREHADNRVTATLLHNKIQAGLAAALSQVNGMSRCGEAAQALTRLASERELQQPNLHAWWAVVTCRLWSELSSSDGVGATTTAVTDYLSEFGVDVTAVAVHVGGLGPESPIWNSTEKLWDRILTEFVAALIDESRDSQEPNHVQQYSYWVEQHPSLYLRVQESIERHVQERPGVDLIGIAANLVTVTTSIGQGEKRLAPPNMSILESIYPRAKWPTDELPISVVADANVSDFSFANRRRVASNALFQHISAESDRS